MAVAPYSLELAEEHIAKLIGQVDRLTEILTQNDFGATPNTPAASGYSMFSSLAHQKYISSGGQDWNTGHKTITITANQNITSTTDAVVGVNSVPMSWKVEAGPSYFLAGMINWTQGSAGVSQNNGYTGPAITGARIRNNWEVATLFATNGPNTREANSLGDQASPAYAAGTAVEWVFTGSMIFSAGGTFSIVASEGTPGDSFTIGAYSSATLFVTT